MKAMQAFRLVGGALIAVISIHAWSQSSDAAATTDQSAAPQTSHSSAKASRKANRVLSRKVLTALSKHGVSTDQINVVAKGGTVTLEGSVLESGLIDKAGSIAKNVSGVTSVKNDLTVREEGQ
ncbi:BON domain-containing protein [Paraburkholderia sp. DHOC27]|uniref:BON domain-containing protein n=1 Tax=Paraburkholderia sp. DHOC27 TaxID=2303330 RepID=UPI000E3E0A75|nr:BON domain-containing protein [Paraburkholderia sp. DHOC27]RFU49834.1 BON domain-containing protein [Paraburkholderia sp. DHOC27]